MKSGVFTQFRKINEPRSKPPAKGKLPHNVSLRKPGVRSLEFSQHGILHRGKKDLVGWKLYGRK